MSCATQVYSDGSVPIEELARMPASKYRTMNSAAHVVRVGALLLWFSRLLGKLGLASWRGGGGW